VSHTFAATHDFVSSRWCPGFSRCFDPKKESPKGYTPALEKQNAEKARGQSMLSGGSKFAFGGDIVGIEVLD